MTVELPIFADSLVSQSESAAELIYCKKTVGARFIGFGYFYESTFNPFHGDIGRQLNLVRVAVPELSDKRNKKQAQWTHYMRDSFLKCDLISFCVTP
jgi:hypothetical protein